ncbi:1-acyl-sn-glycerol-3-phosphate acyltransferase [Sediminitomix flava]|uniref:1-acyl-sn-glycerol-3-phosphate acyltransferase n=1 Tax=Sediminitomix flava TaxID=379075 RepID=A0A315Z7N1_SEDFL|nr:1-acyl-sn-glycerol-3-phosphate acyltransferase [Sediminitomix flava]PWJ40972.1 1-acyl-sn-glycerol-3-phosphate acyltransferase [Sediminitomix flava]
MLYHLIKYISRYVFLKVYLHRVKRVNWDKIPWDKPLILAANHPATLLDPTLLGSYAEKNVHYLAKASLFNSNWKNKLFRSLHMIPVVRAMDKGEGNKIGAKNSDSFQHCYEVLKQNEGIVIFSEGVSIWGRQLKKLKSGTARIAFGAELENNYDLDVYIVPISLNYTDITRPFSSVMMVAGEPIRIRDYQIDYEENSSATTRKVTKLLEDRLTENLYLTDGRSQEIEIEMISGMYFESSFHNLKVGYQLKDHLDWQKNVGHYIQRLKEEDPERLKFIRKQIDMYQASINIFGLKDYAFWYKNQNQLRISLAMILGFIISPIFLWGVFHHYPIYKSVQKIAKKLAQPVESWAPVMLILASIALPLSYWVYASIYQHFFNQGLIVYLLSLPISAYTAGHLWYYYKTRGIQWRRLWLRLRHPNVYKQIEVQRNKVLSLIDDVIKTYEGKEI